MEINFYCIRCGGRLEMEDGHVACMSCNTEYSNILVSESREENDEKIAIEMSVCIDCLIVKPKINVLTAALEYSQAEIANAC